MLNKHTPSEMKEIGVYKITNLLNGKCYVGSTAWKFSYRLSKHVQLLTNNKHPNVFMQADWNTFKAENFKFTILEITDADSNIDREQYWLDETKCYQMGYNISFKAKNGGHGFPDYVIDKLTIAAFKPENEASRVAGYKKWYKENARPVDVFTIAGQFVNTFDSVLALSQYSEKEDNTLPITLKGNIKNKKLRREHILRVLCGQREQMKGLVFIYADN